MKFIIESKTHGRHTILIDDEDAPKVLSRRWCLSKKGNHFYAISRKENVYLHRLIAGDHAGKVIDHVNGNSLDNRKANLRECLHKENIRNRREKNKNNTSGFKGVFAHKESGRWFAQLKYNRRSIRAGYYDTKEEAARAYNAAALQYYGEFASLNTVPPCL